MNVIWLLVAVAVGFIGGYLTCYFWGSSRKFVAEVVDDVEGIIDKK